MRIQLQNTQTVMTIARYKLMQYLSVFRKHIPGDSLHELHQAMDGIEEVNITIISSATFFFLLIQYFFVCFSCANC